MRVILNVQLLFIASVSTYVLNAPFSYVKRSADVNLCQTPCASSCSPDCLPNCCVKSIQPNLPSAPAVKSSAPNTGVALPSKPEMMISSVEEGETEECGEKGFNSPTDDSEDPPGTITIPLPPTMYVPPKPGEAPKELPMPDFKLPASILQGVPPPKSMTLTPEPMGETSSANTVSEGNQTPIPPPVINAPVAPPAIIPDIHRIPPSPPSSGLMYPKLPPVTVSEIPGRKPVAPVASKLLVVSPGGIVSSSQTSPIKFPPVTVSELPGKKPAAPLSALSLAPGPSSALPPPVIKTITPSAVQCVADSRDETNLSASPAAAAVIPPVIGAPVLSDGSTSSIPGVVEVAPSVISLSGSQDCVQNAQNKPSYDVNVVKELHQELTNKLL